MKYAVSLKSKSLVLSIPRAKSYYTSGIKIPVEKILEIVYVQPTRITKVGFRTGCWYISRAEKEIARVDIL